MKIVRTYVADDETIFDNEYDCLEYELRLNNPLMTVIKVYDNLGNKLVDVSERDTYNNSDIIIIRTEQELITLHNVALYCGWSEWEMINSVGTWKYNTEKGYGFIKTP